MKKYGKKIISAVTVFLFLASQISSGYSQAVDNLVAPSSDQSNQIQTITPAQALAKQNAPSASGQVVSPGVPNTYDFIASQDALNQQAEKESEKKEEETKQNYELERYTFEEAQDLFRPEFASAAIIKNLKESDLKKLMDLPFEVGIAILHGELIMFSSGNKSEIDVLNPVNELLKNAEFIAHTHPDGLAINKPSGADILNAGYLTEYVITPAGAYAYNHQGLQNNGNLLSYQYLLNQLQRTLKESRLSGLANEMLVRQELNEFIRQMDILNQAPEDERILFRSGAVIDSNPALGAGNITPLTIPPAVILTGGSNAGSSANQPSSSLVHLNYNVVALNSFSGVTLNYDNFGTTDNNPATIADIETQDISAIANFVFGIRSTAFQIKVEFTDQDGDRDFFVLNDVSINDQFYSLNMSLLDPNVDRTRIQSINFIVDRNSTAPAGRVGTLDLTFANLDVTGNQNADPLLTAANLTQLPFVPRPASPVLIGQNIDFTTTLTQPDSGQVTLAYNLLQNNSFAVAVFSYDDFSTPGVVESGNLTGLPNNEIIVGLTGPAGSIVRVEFEDASSTALVPVKDFLNLGPLSGAQQFFRINLANLNTGAGGINLSQIKGINFVVDPFTVDPVNGTAGRNGSLNIKFGTGLDISGLQGPDNTLSAADVSMMPNVPTPPVPILTGGSNLAGQPNGSSLNQPSSNQLDLTYNILAAGTYAGITINYDDFGTEDNNPNINTDIETRDISNLPNDELIVGLSGPLGSTVRVEFVDIAGRKDSLLVGPVTPVEQFFRLNLNFLSNVDLTQTRFVNFIVNEFTVADRQDVLHLRLNGLTFTPIVAANPALTESNLSNLPLGQPVLTGGSSADSAIARVSGSEIGLDYDVTASGSYAGAAVSYDDFTTVPVEFQNLSALANLVVGVRGHNPMGGERVRVEIVDAAGGKDSIFLDDVNDSEQFYSIPTSLFDAVDLTRVILINFIVDGTLVQDPTNVIQVRVNNLSQPALTAQQQAIRQNLISSNLEYFRVGIGIDPITHFPYDNISATAVPQSFTQPTAIGFYVQMLADISNGLMPSSFLTSSQALTEADLVLTNLISAQASFGWNGLLPFLNLSPLAPSTNIVGFGDNANLAQSLAVMIGGLERGTYSPADQIIVNGIITKANTVLANMAPGFNALIDPTFGLFHNSVNTSTGQFISYQDRHGNEFRAAVAFIVAFYGINRSVWDNMLITTRNYRDSGGTIIENFSPFDGGAFQIFWPLLRTSEQKFVEMLPSLRNALYTFADFSKRNNIPGFVSASSVPEGGYQGLQGIIDIAEIIPDVLNFDIGSVYALAAAFAVDPDFVIFWLDNIRAQFPALSGPFGLFDSARSFTELNQRYFAIDQSSIVLGLANNGGDNFDAFMANRGLDAAFAGLYEDLFIDITPNTKPLPTPPTVPARTFTVFNNFSSEGITGTFPFQATNITGLNINYAGMANRQGHFWVLDQVHDARGETIKLKYSVTSAPQEIEVELVDALNNRLGLFTVPIVAGPGVQEATIQVPNLPAFQFVDQVRIILNPPVTGVQSANFKVHQFTFSYLGLPVVLQPSGSLTAADVTTIPGNPFLIRTGGSTAATSVNQQSASQFALNFNNTIAGQYGGATITPENFGVAGNETVDISTIPQLVFGISSTVAATQAKIELEDVNGVKAIFNVANLGAGEQFYAIDVNSLPPGFDRTRVHFINFIVDSVNAGILNVRTGGLLFTTFFGPDGTQTIANVTDLTGAPVARLVRTGGSTAATAVNQISGSQFTLSYNNAVAGNYGGATITFDDFGTDDGNPATTTDIERRDLTGVANLVFGLSGNIATAKVEIVDVNNVKAVFNLNGITAAEQFWRLPLSSGLPAGFQLNNVTSINIIEDGIGSGNLNVRLSGVEFIPVIGQDNNSFLADVSVLNSPSPEVISTFGSSAGSFVTQLSASEIQVDFNNTAAGQYGGGTLNFDNFGTAPVEFINLSSLTDLVFGLRSNPDFIDVKLELVDAAGNSRRVILSTADSTERFFRIPLTNFSGVNLNQIRFINFVVDQPGAGNITVRANGQQFIPTVTPTTTVTTADITTLPTVTGGTSFPIPGVTNGSGAGTTVTSNTTVSPNRISLDYNVTQAGSHSGTTILYENFSTPQNEVGDLTAGGNNRLVFGVRRTGAGSGNGTIRLKLELVDANGARATVFVDSVTANPALYEIPLSMLPAGFDRTRISMLSYVVDQNGLTGGAPQVGNIEVTLNGIQ